MDGTIPDYTQVGKISMDHPFNYDLDSMKDAIASPSHTMPHFDTFEEFREWMNTIPSTIVAEADK
jgi:hypothetical protein